MTYLDTNFFVASIIDSGELGNKARSLLGDKNKRLTTSVLTYDEVVWVIRKTLDVDASVKAGKGMLSLANVKYLELNKITLAKAQELIENYSFKPRDALHAATAMLNNENELLSEDKDFDRLNIKRVSLKHLK